MNAPITLFVYNRPDHTRQTVEALKKNIGAEESELIIYSDAPKNNKTATEVGKVREYIRSIDGFRSVHIIEREKNWGLARSIIDGVTEVVSQCGQIIVLEDDIVTSPYFLNFMNRSLVFFQDKKRVWHISGWTYPIKTEGLNDVFFWRVMNCWGWATWSDRWKNFEKNPTKLINEFTAEQRYYFDLDGSGVFWSQVIENFEKKIDTWAIFWYASIYQNQGLCLNPAQTYVENIGIDGSGVHCGNSRLIKRGKLSSTADLNLDVTLEESSFAVEEIKAYYRLSKRPITTRLINKLSRTLLNKSILQ